MNKFLFYLVAATRRQLAFMARATTARAQLAPTAAFAVAEYQQFLELAGAMATAVPTLAADFVWHTHMQRPERYATESVAVAGRSMLDHDDDVTPSALQWAAGRTAAAAGGDAGIPW